MNFSRKTLLAFAAALVVLAARPARAQFSLGGHVSYTEAGDADGTWAGGAQLRLRFPGPLGVEGLIDYRRTTYSAKARVSVHVDVRYVFLGVNSIDAIRDRYHNNPKADFWHGTAGLNFKF